MRYLLQNRKEATIAIASIIVGIFDIVSKICGLDMNIAEETIQYVVSGVLWVLCGYFNMPTSKENCEHTGNMRQEKREKKKGYCGERFYTDGEVE